RSSEPGGRLQPSRLVERSARPAGPTIATARGRRRRRSVANPAPNPEGEKTSVWLSGCCQLPGVRGDSSGRAEPSTAVSGCENVSRIGAPGVSRVPGAGELASTGELEGGNQLTLTGPPNHDHKRERLTGCQLHSGRQAPATKHEWDRAPVGPESTRVNESPSKRLHLQARQRRRVGGERRPRQHQHRRQQPRQRDHYHRGEAPKRPRSPTTGRAKFAPAQQLGRGR